MAYDGGPSHFRKVVVSFLKGNYSNHWIDRGDSIAGSSRCADLNLLNFGILAAYENA